MKQKAILIVLFLLAFSLSVVEAAPQRARKRTSQTRRPAKKKPAVQPQEKQSADEATEEEDEPKTEEQLKVDLEALLNRPVAERVPRLRFFLQDYPQSALHGRATEHLISALAALGDEKLQAGDASGVEHFKEALSLVPAEMTDKFFVEVVSQFPANLFLRGQGATALEAARAIESKVKDNAQRLLLIGTFYLSVEAADDALRVAEAASALAPDLVAAHLARSAALRMAFRLDDAAAAYARALELDPNSAVARRSLADLRRADGKTDEALELYREQLAADPADAAARAGVILSLFDAGKKEEAGQQLDTALKENPSQLALLTGAAYWYAAHGEAERALDLAGQAVRLEPRYTWAQIALARALIANKRPLDAERALRLARQYGRFPTLDYELANALAAAGLYEEAAEELSRTFTLKGDGLETLLAGRVPSSAESFTELLAPERRASIFQNAAADTEDRARMLKGLLALRLALKEKEGTAKESAANAAATAATQFAVGEDELNALRKLYAANQLLRQGVALETVRELVEGSKRGVEAALDTPVATNAIMAEELRDTRARAISLGATPDIPDVPRNVLSNILRGRIEETIGWTLFNQNQMPEAVTALRRAASVMPPNSLYWRNVHWRLGAALKANNQNAEALAAYLKSYDPRRPDPARRAIIEALYKEINGTLEGLDAKLNQKPSKSAAGLSALAGSAPQTKTQTPTDLPASDAIASPSIVAPANSATPETAPATTNASDATLAPPPQPETNPPPTSISATRATIAPAPSPEADKAGPSTPAQSSTSALTPEPIPTPTPTAAPAEVTTPVPATEPPFESSPSSTPEQIATAESFSPPLSSEPTPSVGKPDRETKAARTTRRRRVAAPPIVSCTLSLDAEALAVNSGGGATLIARLDGHTGDIDATTPDWSHIIILRDPLIDADATNSAAFKFTIASIGKTPGQFNITFKSPCGKKELPVTIK